MVTTSCGRSISYGNITTANVNQLRKMNASLFPVRYPDQFYADIPDANPDFNQLVYVDNVAVGAVCCRIEPPKSPGGHDSLYIMTLGVLATWRRRNIGTHLLRRVLESLPRHPSVKEVYLHVQTNNDEAVGFYKEHGFNVEETIANYYKRIDPPDCFVLRKRLFQEGDKR
ncbi:unnamed protein product [Ectocarpus sp. 6 AP-2014]